MARQLNALKLILPLLTLPTFADSPEKPVRVDVFTTGTIDMTGIEQLQQRLPEMAIDVQIIDGIERIKKALSKELSPDTRIAKQTAIERLQAFGAREREQLQRSTNALVLAWRYDLHRYPAVVFDRRYVVYGVTDLQAAYALFRRWHKANES